MMSKIDLGWGEPFCVRDVLKKHYKKNFKINIDKLSYAEDYGNQDLIELTREFLKQSTGIDYKYIIITNGTTSAINIVLRTMKKAGKVNCYTNEYYFPYYPDIVYKNGLNQVKKLESTCNLVLNKRENLTLLDSPSNPFGKFSTYNIDNVIWDSVYHNDVYLNEHVVVPNHIVNCGSYSKFLGLTGARIGWIATNDKNQYNKYCYDSLYENCTISNISQLYLLDVMSTISWYYFSKDSKELINNNRNELNRISYLFNNQVVPKNGMFYCVWADKKSYNIVNKANVKFIKIDEENDKHLIRFNLAQKNDLTKKAVNAIIKVDDSN
jgi:aspartate/methionine/tyrosine aminotransferase